MQGNAILKLVGGPRDGDAINYLEMAGRMPADGDRVDWCNRGWRRVYYYVVMQGRDGLELVFVSSVPVST